jgi:hypothetical protein
MSRGDLHDQRGVAENVLAYALQLEKKRTCMMYTSQVIRSTTFPVYTPFQGMRIGTQSLSYSDFLERL